MPVAIHHLYELATGADVRCFGACDQETGTGAGDALLEIGAAVGAVTNGGGRSASF
jgi:hypothetical protein